MEHHHNVADGAKFIDIIYNIIISNINELNYFFEFPAATAALQTV